MNLISAIQAGSPAAVIASAYNIIEVRTNFTPPVLLRTEDVFQPLLDAQLTAEPKAERRAPWWLQALKPTVTVSGAAGSFTIAPQGEAGDGTIPMLLVLGSIVGVGFVLGRWTK